MPCETRGGVVVCSRGPSRSCHICGKPMVARCDATRKDGTPCDAPMCAEHRHQVGDDIDVCRYHNYPRYIEGARRNRRQMKEAQKYFFERYQNSKIGAVPSHWPEFRSKEEVDRWFDETKREAYLLKKYVEERGQR